MKFERFNNKWLKLTIYTICEILLSIYIINWLGMKATISLFVGFIVGFLIAMIYHDFIKMCADWMKGLIPGDQNEKTKK